MSQIQSALLMLVAAILFFAVIFYVVWRRTQPAAAPRVPRMPRAPREAGESKLPRLPRRDREAEAPVEISANRLARISARPALDRLTEAAPEPAPEPVAERPTPPATLPSPAPGTAPDSKDAFDADVDQALLSHALETMVAEVEQKAERIAIPGTEPATVRLALQIPPRAGEVATSWLGGRPRLDPGAVWPEIRDVPGDFIAQIACADLPADIWNGLGPRRGSIAIFIHPRDGDAALVPVFEAGEPLEPPFAIDGNNSFFAPHGTSRFGDLMPFMRHAFPEWPVDLVAVRPGDPDPGPLAPASDDVGDALARTGFDIADPAFHPFDWDMMRAMVDILAMRIARVWRDVPVPSPIDIQLVAVEDQLAAGDYDAVEGERLENQHAALTELAAASDAAARTNRAAQRRADEIVTIIRDSGYQDGFTPDDAAAVMEALNAIHWTKVNRKPDPDGRPGAERIESLTLPLTAHHPDAPLWVHDYLSIWFDHAKHAFAANPDALSDAARAMFIPWARGLAARERPGIGHIPFQYVHDYDEDRDATLIELPTSGLMSWMFGDGHNLAITLRKADLAAGRWDRPHTQVGN